MANRGQWSKSLAVPPLEPLVIIEDRLRRWLRNGHQQSVRILRVRPFFGANFRLSRANQERKKRIYVNHVKIFLIGSN